MGMEINGNYNNYSANYDYSQKTDDAKETVKAAETEKQGNWELLQRLQKIRLKHKGLRR